MKLPDVECITRTIKIGFFFKKLFGESTQSYKESYKETFQGLLQVNGEAREGWFFISCNMFLDLKSNVMEGRYKFQSQEKHSHMSQFCLLMMDTSIH